MSGYTLGEFGNIDTNSTYAQVAPPSLKDLVFAGGVNASVIGASNHGSTEANIAQREEMVKHINNFLQGGGDQVTYMTLSGQNGKAISHPYVDGETGELIYPNENGLVRSINGDYLDRWKEINEQVENRIDDVMEYCIVSDELAAFTLGIKKNDWDTLCAKKGKLPGMSDEMAELACSIKYIKSLPSGSVNQTMSLSKLRYIVREHLRNVNIKRLVSKKKMAQDVTKGDLVPKTVGGTAIGDDV